MGKTTPEKVQSMVAQPIQLRLAFPDRGLMRIGATGLHKRPGRASHPYTGQLFVRINLEADEPGPVSCDPELPTGWTSASTERDLPLRLGQSPGQVLSVEQ